MRALLPNAGPRWALARGRISSGTRCRASASTPRACNSSLERQPLSTAEQVVQPSTYAVTGASGYIGARLTERLLALGHTVHAVCLPREVEDKERSLKHLLSLPGAQERLKLFAGDVLKPGACEEALRGAQALLHLAAVVKILADKQEQQAMVDTALQGTRNVLGSVSSAAGGSVRHVVMLSSIAAVVGDNWERGQEYVYTEQDWAIDCRPGYNTYNYTKMASEKLAYELEGQQDRWTLTTINPGVVFGPVSHPPHAATSPGMLLNVLKGSAPTLDLFTFFADVDDVAAATSSAAALGPRARGRHIVVGQATSLHTVHDLLIPLLPGWSAPGKTNLPGWLVQAAPGLMGALTGADIGVLRATMSKPARVDSSKALKALGISNWIPWQQTVLDTALTCGQLGLAEVGQAAVAQGASIAAGNAAGSGASTAAAVGKGAAYREMP